MIKTYDVTFKSLRELLRLLGYAGVMSKKMIEENYGSLDQLVAQRLQLSDSEQIKNKLLELSHRKAINDHLCLAFFRAIYEQIDTDKKQTIINTIASINNIDASALIERIEQALK